jgi:hypothetical protein
MAGTETISAPCPNCKKAMYQKHESSLSGFMFDACFSCGYASGECDRTSMTALEIWNSILEHFKVKSISELVESQEWLDGSDAGKDPEFKEPIFVPDDNLESCIVDINEIIILN